MHCAYPPKVVFLNNMLIFRTESGHKNPYLIPKYYITYKIFTYNAFVLGVPY